MVSRRIKIEKKKEKKKELNKNTGQSLLNQN